MSGAEFFARALLTEGPLRDMAEERVKQAFKHAKHGQGAVLRFNANGNHEQAYPKDLLDSSIILVVKTTAGTFEMRSSRDHPTANMKNDQKIKGFRTTTLHKLLAYYTLYLEKRMGRLQQLVDRPEDCSHITQPPHHPTMHVMAVRAIFEPHKKNLRRIACGIVGVTHACCVCNLANDETHTQCAFWPHVTPHKLTPV